MKFTYKTRNRITAFGLFVFLVILTGCSLEQPTQPRMPEEEAVEERGSDAPAAVRQSGDLKRHADLQTLATGMLLFQAEHERYPASIPRSGQPREICRTGSQDCKGLIDLAEAADYVSTPLPVDPAVEDERSTGYAALVRNDQLVLTAPYAEDGVIEVMQ